MVAKTPREAPLEDLTDRELLVRIVKVAEHLDPMIHEIHGWASAAAPLLERFGHSRAAALFAGKPKRGGSGG